MCNQVEETWDKWATMLVNHLIPLDSSLQCDHDLDNVWYSFLSLSSFAFREDVMLNFAK